MSAPTLSTKAQLRFDPSDIERIDAEARLRGCSRSEVIRSAVREKLGLPTFPLYGSLRGAHS